MKRKLLCITLIIVGSVAIIGTILFSLDRFGYLDSSPVWRFEYPDASPAFTLIIISIVTIVAAVRRLNYEPNSNKAEVSGRERVLLRAFRVMNILSIFVCVAFIVIMFFLTDKYSSSMHYVFLLMLFALAGVVAAALGLKERPPIIGRDIAKATVALAISAALVFVYLSYMPKYSTRDGINILHSDEKLVQKDVFNNIDVMTMGIDVTIERDLSIPFYMELFGGNPFYTELFEYGCDSYGYDSNGLHLVKGYILFNPATGAYEYMRTQKQDKTYGPGGWPEFNWNIVYDRDEQHNAALNLYFRKWWPFNEYCDINGTFFVGSGEWDAKMKDVMYPHNFPEDEALIFLKSMGEETLKTTILEHIYWADSRYKDKTIEVYFYGIDIAIYKNGEVILKL